MKNKGNTKQFIKDQARLLFNEKGFEGVSFREVAKFMGIRFGNLTYHFPTKDSLILALFQDLILEQKEILAAIQKKGVAISLPALLAAPLYTFDISIKYIFLFKEYAQIIRTYPAIAQYLNESHQKRKESYLPFFQILQKEGIIENNFSAAHLENLMEISGMVRTFFFIALPIQALQSPHLEKTRESYLNTVNQVLFPYLTPKGRSDFEAFNVQTFEAQRQETTTF
ncbi:TetR/AcrR family transcriptional regulator [Hugenholtzia roseola]|uniref:TetR/AcrR family transcriptional regulator n=1 Tax=Hugenholtzia roseola TaxID=1002 RepID=UPI0004037FF4|nr:TetR/AcrR family transcriptional regulator [Hugenholtzia roseola]